MSKKGFTLVEVLAVVVIMGILLLVSIPAVTKNIATSKDKVFFSNVSSVISNLKKERVLNGKKYCIYEPETKAEDIESLRIVVARDNSDNNIYIVTAKRKGSPNELDIVTLNFDELTATEKSKWKPSNEADLAEVKEKIFEVVIEHITEMQPCVEKADGE